MIDLSGYLQETLYHSFLKKDILNLYQDRKKEKRMGLDAQIKQAKWICAPQAFISPVFQRRIHLTGRARGSIALSASGFFVLFVNGQRVGEDYYLSANSLFHARNLKDLLYPVQDCFTYRCYYSVYELPSFPVAAADR